MIQWALFHKAVRKLRTTLRTTGDQFLCYVNENLNSVVTKNMYLRKLEQLYETGPSWMMVSTANSELQLGII